MRRRLIPVNVVIAALLFILLSLEPDHYTAPVAVMERGELLYNRECRSCHGNEQAEKIMLSKTKLIMGPRVPLIKTMLKGTVNNDKAGDNTSGVSLHAYNDFTDQQLSDVLTYLRNSFGNTAKPITPADIRKVRHVNKK